MLRLFFIWGLTVYSQELKVLQKWLVRFWNQIGRSWKVNFEIRFSRLPIAEIGTIRYNDKVDWKSRVSVIKVRGKNRRKNEFFEESRCEHKVK